MVASAAADIELGPLLSGFAVDGHCRLDELCAQLLAENERLRGENGRLRGQCGRLKASVGGLRARLRSCAARPSVRRRRSRAAAGAAGKTAGGGLWSTGSSAGA